MKTKKFLPVMLFIAAFTLAACAPAAVEPVAEATTSAAMAAQPTAAPVQPTTAPVQPTALAAAVEISFSKDVWPIIEKYALAAHGGNGGVFLENYNDILKYVVAGKPEESMLYKALIGDGLKRMPPDAPLPNELIQTIYTWILQGAKNN